MRKKGEWLDRLHLQWFSDLDDLEGDPFDDDADDDIDDSEADDVDEGKLIDKHPFLAQLADEYKERQDIADLGSFNGLVADWDELKAKIAELESASELGEEGGDKDSIAEENDRLKTKINEMIDYKENALLPPEKPEDYEFELPEEQAETFQGIVKTMDEVEGEGWFDGFREVCHELQLTKAQAQLLFLRAVESNGYVVERSGEAIVQIDKDLRRRWKGDYKVNVEKSSRAMRQFVTEDQEEYLSSTKLSSDPVLKEIFKNIYDQVISEDSLAPGSPTRIEPKKTDKERKLAERYDHPDSQRAREEAGR